MKERRAVCVLIFRPDGKILAINRKNKPYGFGLVGGKVDSNESDSNAIVREAKEEAGINIIATYKVYERYSDVVRESDGVVEHWTISTFYAFWDGEIKSSDEGEACWVSMYDLIAGPFGEYNSALFKHLGCEIDDRKAI
jgi:ADP-ribose pyrophosphatase YjhB (NUDIX family)